MSRVTAFQTLFMGLFGEVVRNTSGILIYVKKNFSDSLKGDKNEFVNKKRKEVIHFLSLIK